MRYFTNNPLERLMMQKPKAVREDSPSRRCQGTLLLRLQALRTELRSPLLP